MEDSKTMGKTKLGVKTVCGLVLAVLVILGGKSMQADDSLKWYRGQLHCHTFWSDGRAFPEQVIDTYKQRGYQFICMTDHNQFAENTNNWKDVIAAGESSQWVTSAVFDNYVKTYGKEWVESKNEAGRSVRLKTYADVKAKFEDPGKFILMPGVELTQTLNGLAAHLNYINLPVTLPVINKGVIVVEIEKPDMTISSLLAQDASEAGQAALKLQRPYLMQLNHPFWPYFDIIPQNLIDCSEILFFEISNTTYELYPQALTYTLDKFWDIINAFRLVQGKPLLYGTAGDDAHSYEKNSSSSGWVVVHATALTAENLLAAMHRGDFYASNGVFLQDVVFTPADNTLRVVVKAEPGVNYRINFITTKRGFDRSLKEIVIPADEEKNQAARIIPVYSEDIGRTVKSVAGTEAVYKLEADDLYVRARVESDISTNNAPNVLPKVKTAWTQPYVAAGAPSK